MTDTPTSRFWPALALLAALGTTLVGCGSEEPSEAPEPPAAPAAGAPAPVLPPGIRVHTGAGASATRKVREGCEPGAAAREYAGLVGERAFAILSWTGASERTAALRIPVFVASIEDDAVGVRILQIPMREEYMLVWLGSGHIRATTGDTFLLDPCSAALEPWSAEAPTG